MRSYWVQIKPQFPMAVLSSRIRRVVRRQLNALASLKLSADYCVVLAASNDQLLLCSIAHRKSGQHENAFMAIQCESYKKS